MDPKDQLEKIRQSLKGDDFSRFLSNENLLPLHTRSLEILQINITRKCNLQCKHCHVKAGPDRTEEMSKDLLLKCIEIAALPEITTIDITGGAPEMHPHLSWFLNEISALKKRLIVRSNLIILLEPEYNHYIKVFANQGVELVASVPDPDSVRTDKQRGSGTFVKIIEAMRMLNSWGYGMNGSDLVLDLVYNPAGAYLAGPQLQLEQVFKQKLNQTYGVHFTKLFCLNNCPIGRYLDYLIESDNIDDYMQDLVSAFNASAAQNVMCRSTLSIGYDGTLYDCDFNQMLSMPVDSKSPQNIMDFNITELIHRQIKLDNHCFACTAGAGSSCQGVTT